MSISIYQAMPLVLTSSISQIMVDTIKSTPELQNISETEKNDILNKSINLIPLILNNISSSPCAQINITEFREFIKREVEKINTNINNNTNDDSEYSNYVIKPNFGTIIYYAIFLSNDDDYINNMYISWCNIKKMCNLLTNLYKDNMTNSDNLNNINFFITMNDVFNKFTSSTIEIIPDEDINSQNGGGTEKLAIILLWAFLLIFITLYQEYEKITTGTNPQEFNKIMRAIDYSKPEIQSREVLASSSYNDNISFVGQVKDKITLVTLETILNDVARNFVDVNRTSETNIALGNIEAITIGLSKFTESSTVRGIATIFENNPYAAAFKEKRAEFLSTKIVSSLYKLGLSSGDIYRLLYLGNNFFIEFMPLIEKLENIKKNSVDRSEIQSFRKNTYNLLSTPPVRIILDSILASSGLAPLIKIKDVILYLLKDNEDPASLEAQLLLVKSAQSDLQFGLDIVQQIMIYSGEGSQITTTNESSQPQPSLIDDSYPSMDGGIYKKRKTTKKRRNKKTTKKRRNKKTMKKRRNKKIIKNNEKQ